MYQKEKAYLHIKFTNTIKNQKTGDENMNSFKRLEQLAKQYKALYPKGTRIELEMMESDPRPIEPGTTRKQTS